MAVMTYESFIDAVERVAHIDAAEAERVACATLRTLGERVSGGEMEDIAERLPERLRSCISPAEEQERFHVDEFLRRIAERTQLDMAAAQHDASAVFAALFRSVGREEFHDLRSELPKDFDPLLDEGLRYSSMLATGGTQASPVTTAEEFFNRVADRADIARERARRAAETVLELLAIRISGRQAKDLARRLPPELRPAIERGIAQSGETARTLGTDEFLREVVRRESVSMDEAANQVRAVFTTLRETVGEKEFRDTVSQLPKDFEPLLRYEG